MPNAYTLNQKPPSYGQALSTMVEMLVGAGWTYQSSGSGTNGVVSASSTVTISSASPGIVSWTSHGLTPNVPVVFTNTGGALPAAIVSGTTYFVSYQSFTANSFAVSATQGGTPINTASASTGTTTATVKKVFTTPMGLNTVAISNASPAVVTLVNHGLHPGDSIRFTGTLPTGLSTSTTYFVLSTSFTADTFRVATSVEGSAINTSSAGTPPFTINPLTSWGNANAWGRIQDPGGVREFTFQASSNAVRFKYSKGAKFTAGSPSVSATPSATDEVILFGAGTDASPSFQTWFNAGTVSVPNTVIYQGAALAAAPYGFWFCSHVQGTSLQAGNGGKSSTLMFDPVTGVPEDTDPYVIHVAGTFGFATQSNTSFGRDGGVSASVAATWAITPGASDGCFAFTDSTNFRYVQPAMYGTWLTGQSSGANGTSLVAGQGTVLTSSLAVNPFNGKNEMLPMAYLRVQGGTSGSVFPSTAAPMLKGWSTLMRWTTVSRNSFMDTLNNKAWICVWTVWLPWDGATTPIA